MIILYLFVGVVYYAAAEQIQGLAEDGTVITFYTLAQMFVYGLSFIYAPIITGLVGCGFICSYYAYRGYYNLEIGMRNRVLYVLSELVVLFILGAIIYALSSATVFLMNPLAKSGESLIQDGYKFIVYTFGVQLVLGLSDASNALLFAHLFRKKGKSFVVYLAFWAFSLIFSYHLINWLPKRYEFLSYILFPSFFTWFTNDTPFFAGGFSITKIVICVGVVIKIMVTFALSVLLFNRKVEEKRV